jgi:CRISPR-associated protein Cas1
MEELRPCLADRLVLSLINRAQAQARDFTTDPAGGVRLTDDARRTVLKAYQERKRDEITHPFLGEKMPIGLLPHAQALLLARHLRGDLAPYPPFAWK